ncbi:MAG: GDSL-type esterase/lipase family protein [Lachnospiraceae bacterium]|nr:GDSL-type esterase/lipase family protein [Lachnospiraceae bacterium]
MIRILCFGDSNTYGYRPDGLGRFDEKMRWPMLLGKLLGAEYQIVEEGLCGRTTVFDNPVNPGRRGSDQIGMLMESHNPVDLLLVMLGTNDYKVRYQTSVSQIVQGMDQVIKKALEKASGTPKILMISPVHLMAGVEDIDPEYDVASVEKSCKMAEKLENYAREQGYFFLDAATVAAPGRDGEHMEAEGHQALAAALYKTCYGFK